MKKTAIHFHVHLSLLEYKFGCLEYSFHVIEDWFQAFSSSNLLESSYVHYNFGIESHVVRAADNKSHKFERIS